MRIICFAKIGKKMSTYENARVILKARKSQKAVNNKIIKAQENDMEHLNYLKIYPEGISTNGRPKVYFTCHPQDFRYFSEICESIRKNHDCVICYTEDMTRPLPEEYRATDLGAMNLFVMPVTFRLLTEPSRAMDSDFAFVDENNIPVLPLMMEDGIGDLYTKKFGKRQYLSLYSHDSTAISYRDILDEDLFSTYLLLMLHEKADADNAEIIDTEYLDALTSLHKFAASYGRLGEYEKALELSESAYSLCVKALGEEHPDTLTTLNSLALSYGNLGEYEKALELSERAYSLRAKVLGEEHPDTLTSLYNLAAAYNDLGNYKKAVELYEKAYALYVEVFGEEDLYTLATLYSLALSYGNLGEYEKALELNERAYSLRVYVLGEEHPHTLASLNSLAHLYYNLGNYEKAIKLFAKMYTVSVNAFGEEHQCTRAARYGLSQAIYGFGDEKRALEVLEEYYKGQLQGEGEDDE